MKKILAFLSIIATGFAFTSFGPWYLIALAGLVGGFVLKNQWSGLLIGFLAGFTLWALQIWLMANASESDLPSRMASLFGLPGATSLILVSAVVGGLLTGFGAAAGANLQRLFTGK